MLSITIKVLIMSRRIACFIYATFISNGCPNADVFNTEVLASFCFSVYKQQNGPLYLTLTYRCLEIVINYGNLHPVSLGQEHFAQSYTLKNSTWTFMVSSGWFVTVTMQPTFADARRYHLLLSTEEFLQLFHLETMVWDLWCYIAETCLVSDLQFWRLHATPSS